MKGLFRKLSVVPTGCDAFIVYRVPPANDFLQTLVSLSAGKKGTWIARFVYRDNKVITCEVVREAASGRIMGTITETPRRIIEDDLKKMEFAGQGRFSRDKLRSTVRKLNYQNTPRKGRSDSGDPCLDWLKELLGILEIAASDFFFAQVKCKA